MTSLSRFVAILGLVAVVSAFGATGVVLGQSSQGSRVVVYEDEPGLEPYREEFQGGLFGIDMIPVPGGSIVLETEEGPEEIEVGPFYIGRTEIPWELYDMYVYGSDETDELTGIDAVVRPSRPYGAPDRGFGHRGYAAISMSPVAAEEFTYWLSMLTGKDYRLPTEAEWEYACRAGRNEPIPEDELEEHAWFWDNAFDKTHPIGRLEPNDWGLHDMMGNVAEWCFGLDGQPLACGGSFMSRVDEVGCSARMVPTPRWQETDPQIPKSMFWLTDAPFVGLRVIAEP